MIYQLKTHRFIIAATEVTNRLHDGVLDNLSVVETNASFIQVPLIDAIELLGMPLTQLRQRCLVDGRSSVAFHLGDINEHLSD